MVDEPKQTEEPKGARKEFLLQMYIQLFNDINRHLTVVWQAAGVVAGAFAVFALTEKGILSADFAVTLVVLLCGWMLAHVIDAAYWYNRNLLIISNIEKQFLFQTDLRDIIYYFGRHRPSNKMITHLKIQRSLGTSILVLAILFHFFTRILPGFRAPFSSFDPSRTLPYIFAILVCVYLFNLWEKQISDYEEALRNSPGKEVNVTGIDYGGGHGYGKLAMLFSPVPLFRWIKRKLNSKEVENKHLSE